MCTQVKYKKISYCLVQMHKNPWTCEDTNCEFSQPRLTRSFWPARYLVNPNVYYHIATGQILAPHSKGHRKIFALRRGSGGIMTVSTEKNPPQNKKLGYRFKFDQKIYWNLYSETNLIFRVGGYQRGEHLQRNCHSLQIYQCFRNTFLLFPPTQSCVCIESVMCQNKKL